MRRRRSRVDVLRDPEVLELLRDEPELLAIADTIHATLGQDYRQRHRRRRIARLGAFAVVVSAAVSLALVQPWSGGGGGLVGQALAAIPGNGRVVHALLSSRIPGVEIVDLRTGRVQPEQVTYEFWFDPDRDLLHTLIRRDDVVISDIVATPEKTVSAAGTVLGGTSDSLDPTLLAFASGYRQALASGAARPIGRTLAGNRVPPTVDVTTPFGREQVTLDRTTLRPRVIRPLLPNGKPSPQTARVIALSTLSPSAANFVTHAHHTTPSLSGGAVEASTPIAIAQAHRALPRTPLWVGEQLAGLPLHLLVRQRLSRMYPTGANAKTSGSGIDLIYGALRNGRPDWRASFLEIQQAPAPEPAYGFLSGPLRVEPLPPRGLLRLEREVPSGTSGHALWRGELRRAGLYLALTGSSRDLVVIAARVLRPIPSS